MKTESFLFCFKLKDHQVKRTDQTEEKANFFGMNNSLPMISNRFSGKMTEEKNE